MSERLLARQPRAMEVLVPKDHRERCSAPSLAGLFYTYDTRHLSRVSSGIAASSLVGARLLVVRWVKHSLFGDGQEWW